MSAAPQPIKPTDDADAQASEAPAATERDAEGWALLEALRRKLDDQAAQGRKTQAHVTQLADSIAALVADQRQRTRWLNLNSFVAYLVFTLLCGGAAYLMYKSRVSSVISASEQLRADRDAALRRADDASAKLAARDAGDARAAEILGLIAAGKRDDAAAKLAASPELSRALRDLIAVKLKGNEPAPAEAALKAAKDAFRAGRLGDVTQSLDQALAAEPNGAHAPEMHYLIGVTQLRLGVIDAAVSHLELAAIGDSVDDDVRFQLASALDRAGQAARARSEYDRFASAHPQSPFAPFALRRIASLAKPQAPAGDATAPASAPNSAPSAGSAAPAPSGSPG